MMRTRCWARAIAAGERAASIRLTGWAIWSGLHLISMAWVWLRGRSCWACGKNLGATGLIQITDCVMKVPSLIDFVPNQIHGQQTSRVPFELSHEVLLTDNAPDIHFHVSRFAPFGGPIAGATNAVEVARHQFCMTQSDARARIESALLHVEDGIRWDQQTARQY